MLGPRSDEPVPTLVSESPTFKFEASPDRAMPPFAAPIVLSCPMDGPSNDDPAPAFERPRPTERVDRFVVTVMPVVDALTDLS